jgi:putative peptide zinc metalloprotease protein
MSSSLFHPHWYRVADLHPRLRGHITTRRLVVRKQVWYVLSDPADGRHFRLNPVAYRFVGLCDGQRSVQQVWDLMSEALGDSAPTQGELIGILGRLSEGGLLQSEALPDVDVMFENRSVRREQQRWSQLNPLFFRVRLMDPTPWLQRFDPWLGRLFGPAVVALWLALVLTASLLAAMNWPALTAHAAERVASPMFALLGWICYPFIKALHELGHALAIRRWGGQVSKVGITLLLLMPIPWVDASAASAFRFRRRRLIVSAAGIMVELLLAALALFLWLNVEPGKLKDIALAVMLVAGVSTVLFNGNPLMRYDGYFILADAIDLPNLAPRSSNYWAHLIRKRLFGEDNDPPVLAPGERPWLLFYGIASLAYRVFISFAIVLWLSGISAFLAGLAGLILLLTFFVKPGMTLYRAITGATDGARQSRRARRAGLAVAVSAVLLLFVLPLPMRIVADGLVWLPENARVRPETEGFVVRLLVADGSQVTAGQPLLELQDDELVAERDRLFAQLAKIQSEQFGVLTREPGKARNLGEEMESVQAAIALNETRLQNLVVRAGSAGRLVIPRPDDLPGTFVPRGRDVGYILADTAARVRAVVSQQDVDLVRERMRGATVWLNETATSTDSRPERDMPSATVRLPSAALGERGGGAIAVDAKDEKGETAAEPVFLVELELPDRRLERVGARAEVRFDLGYEPAAPQMWRRLRQTFISHFTQTG